MTERDIRGNCMALRELILRASRRDPPHNGKQRQEADADTAAAIGLGLALLEGLLVDLNRIADACEGMNAREIKFERD